MKEQSRREFVLKTGKAVAGVGLGSAAAAVRHRAEATTGLVFHPSYLEHRLPDRRGATHPESPQRLTKIIESFRAGGLMDDLLSIEPAPRARAPIEAHHTPEHVEGIRALDVTGRVAERAVAGAIAAVDAVASGTVSNAFCAIRPPGHHANNRGGEEGFCFYSNAAIAAKYAQSTHGFERVAIIDWDYHHGNGTQNAFYEDPSVLFFSTHDWQAYPGTGDPSLTGDKEGTGSNINVHLDCGARDRSMLAAWDSRFLTKVAAFRPDIVIVSAGFDSRRDDTLGCFELSDDVFRRMTRLVLDIARDTASGRVVSLLEGGYNLDGLARAATAHVETLLSAG